MEIFIGVWGVSGLLTLLLSSGTTRFYIGMQFGMLAFMLGPLGLPIALLSFRQHEKKRQSREDRYSSYTAPSPRRKSYIERTPSQTQVSVDAVALRANRLDALRERQRKRTTLPFRSYTKENVDWYRAHSSRKRSRPSYTDSR